MYHSVRGDDGGERGNVIIYGVNVILMVVSYQPNDQINKFISEISTGNSVEIIH